jgi:hypothetical protein
MQSAIHLKTKVQQGGKIEMELPQANEGEDVDIFVIMSSTKPSEDRPSVIDILDEIHRHRPHPHRRSTEEIDRELQAERNHF